MNSRILPVAGATALALAFTASLLRPAHAHEVTPPPVPEKIQVQAGRPVLVSLTGFDGAEAALTPGQRRTGAHGVAAARIGG